MSATRAEFLATAGAFAASPRVAFADAFDAAAAAFADGDFETAASTYAELVRRHPADARALAGLARVRYAENSLTEAADLARRALAADTGAPFGAAVAKGTADRAALLAAPLDAPEETVVPFIATDPLPLVAVRVQDRDAIFYVDTGAGDPVIDPAFATELGVAVEAAGSGTFAGGRQATVGRARVASLRVGDAVMHDVAVDVLPSRAMTIFPRRVDGVLGTRTLMRFTSTIDYAGARLVLRRRRARAAQGTAIRCWWYSDHFIMARGRVNDAPESLYFVDTGLAGAGLLPSPQTVAAAHLDVTGPGGAGQNGAGQAVRAVPFTASSVTLGTVVRRNVAGIWTPEGTPFGIFPFRVAGIVSHTFFRPGALTLDADAMRLSVT